MGNGETGARVGAGAIREWGGSACQVRDPLSDPASWGVSGQAMPAVRYLKSRSDSCVCMPCAVSAVPATRCRSGGLPAQGPRSPPYPPRPLPAGLSPSATCCTRVGWGPAHLEGDVVEVAPAKRGPAGLRGPVGPRLGDRSRSPRARGPGPIGGGQRGGSGRAGPLGLGGLLPGHGGRALRELPLQPPRSGQPSSPRSRSATRTRTRPAAAVAAASLAPRSPPPRPRAPQPAAT